MPPFKFRQRLSVWLLAASFFLIGFFSATGDDPRGGTRAAEPAAQSR